MTTPLPPFPPGTFAPRPGAGSRPAMLAAQAGTELRLALRHGEQVLLTLLIPAVLLVGLTLVDVVALPEPRVAHVVPSVLAAMGVAGFESRIELPAEIHGACVLLIDGLGAELLDAYAEDAPVMAELRGRTLQAGFPSTTVAGPASTS